MGRSVLQAGFRLLDRCDLYIENSHYAISVFTNYFNSSNFGRYCGSNFADSPRYIIYVYCSSNFCFS